MHEANRVVLRPKKGLGFEDRVCGCGVELRFPSAKSLCRVVQCNRGRAVSIYEPVALGHAVDDRNPA